MIRSSKARIDALRRLRIQTHEKDDGGGDTSLYLDLPGEPDCIYFMRTGMCGYEANCRFNHPSNLGLQIGQYGAELPQRVGQPDYGYFLKTGTCKYGASCKYHHPLDRHDVGPLVLNTLGLPMRQDENPCPHYMRTGACKFGIGCKFHHPQPDSAVPVTGPAAYGSTTSWSSPKSTYVSVPRSGSHTYMLVMYPPSQCMVSTPEWNTYMVSKSYLY
ncbi:hypothetical protein POM88_039590 [Heracleum sosnowskyi]|uniref:C3H1-type domain-containing protein n=1 Tax=Heracleum sosnowskyi TaxID=360622 RepID=A0AAD8HBG8_9APIA|nr:hypothetical protein POM88_039590 [Heracleum sosnowskyi]